MLPYRQSLTSARAVGQTASVSQDAYGNTDPDTDYPELPSLDAEKERVLDELENAWLQEDWQR